MSLVDCEWCTGSHFLADDAGLGPCICCTPENMQSIEQLTDWNTVKDLYTERDEAKQILADAGDALARYLVGLGLDPRSVKLEDPELDALLDLLGT